MNQDATLLCDPFAKEAQTSAKPLIQVKSKTSGDVLEKTFSGCIHGRRG